MFLLDNRPIGAPHIDHLEKTSLCKQARFLQQLREDFEEKVLRRVPWPSGAAANETKDLKALKIGDVVLIGSDDKGRLEWPVGRILEMYPRKDGHVRVVKGKTSGREITRPVQCIQPLEVSASQEPPSAAETIVTDGVRGDDLQEQGEPNISCEVKTRIGRSVTLPIKYKT
ncbi:hypothetical protein PR048_022567 [Dryococelus australis]|uniref:DUF5641 domain-containing protein n=1 Tax=Dryococelus australis TaxID=614101 RepID=A0ABQ9H1B8_9NEOP|nr:hypothetical protein PR048_022567 [Dryococelus australis]